MKKKLIWVIIVISTLLDQIIKCVVSFNMNVDDKISLIPNFFEIYYLQNKGAAFSSFVGMRFFLIFISIGVFLILLNYINKTKNIKKIELISLGMIMGGLVGNLIDRIIYGYVIDYLSFTIFNYSFAVFNLADSLIVIGVFCLFISLIIDEFLKREN